ncbi:nucleoside kinase [bacterium]|nr:nucleoside kinase [Bacteroides sp.]MBD5385630.1 nucleoside kinase [bacterium]
MIRIFCVNTGRSLDVEGGASLADVAHQLREELPFSPICAHVNNKTEHLSFRIYAPKRVEFIDARSSVGSRVYVRSLCMLLYRALCDILPHPALRIEHSISGGYLCRLSDNDGNTLTPSPEMLAALKERMRILVGRDLPFEFKEAPADEVIDIFRRQGLDSKVQLLETMNDLYATFYTLDGIADSYYSALAPSTGHIKVFDIVPYHDGFLLLGPDPVDNDVPRQPVTQEKMYEAFRSYLRFNRTIKVSDVGEMNRAVQARKAPELINVAEAMHEKYLAAIADRIADRNSEGGARVVLLAGPSSSGKTTTTKRLAIQLMTNLKTPKMISLDDYFVDRATTPRDEHGDYDYESLYALDLDRLNSDLRHLLEGREVNLPTYSFELGTRIERPRPLRLDPDDVLLIEGIHGLNPELTRALPADDVFKVYVSALTSLSIDDHNWISTTDNRLLRRIVRDHKYRHTSAIETIRRWPSVRRGEEKWIFPFQENADATFNSSLIFELAVMKAYAEPLLRQVPHNNPLYAEAYRLLKLLGYFEPIPAEQVPSTSLLREFLGGSSFHY